MMSCALSGLQLNFDKTCGPPVCAHNDYNGKMPDLGHSPGTLQPII